jgi:hypothetical protein
MLWTMSAAQPAGARLVRSLLGVFGWALVLRFVILNGLAASDGSLARRLFAAALEGLTLGALGLTYYAPATGYIAFVMLALFFVALLLLPGGGSTWSSDAGPTYRYTLDPEAIEPGLAVALPPTDRPPDGASE